MVSKETLAKVPADRLLAAAIREEPGMLALDETATDSASSLRGQLETATEEAKAELGGKGLTLSVEEVVISHDHDPLFRGKGEVYIITSLLDGSGAQPDLQTKEFRGIGSGDRLPLGEGGMLVGSVRDPSWFVDFHMLIMESDEGSKDLAETISEVRKSSGLEDALKLAGALGAFDPTGISHIKTAVGLFLGALEGALKRDGDDHIATIHDFYLACQNWGIGRHPSDGLRQWSDAKVAYEIQVTDI